MMNPLYNAAIYAYRAAAHVAATRSDKVRKMLEGQKRAIDDIEQARKVRAPRGFDIWIHAASLGEFEQARPLIELLRRKSPQISICLSFFSPSGYEVRKNFPDVDCVVYLPFDTPRLAREFIDAINPSAAVFVKYEFWGNLLTNLYERNIPTYLISAIFRPGQTFFKPWGGQFRKMLRCFNHIFLQDEDSRNLLEGIGITNTSVVGDTRFDRVTDIMRTTVSLPALETWTAGSPFTVVAGSSWPEDESHYISWINDHRDVKLILAPHEFDDARIERLTKAFGDGVTLWTQLGPNDRIPSGTRVIIVNCFGLLSSLYRYGDVAIIGGGFGAGIHNINEAAVYGLPVFFGPNHRKFREASQLMECGGAFCYRNTPQLHTLLDKMLTDNDARSRASQSAAAYITRNLGATEKIYTTLRPLLS